MDEHHDGAPSHTRSRNEAHRFHSDHDGSFCLSMTYDSGSTSQSIHLLIRKPDRRMAAVEAEVFAQLLGLRDQIANDL